MITAVDNYVKQNATGQKINDTLNAICDKIPAALKAFVSQLKIDPFISYKESLKVYSQFLNTFQWS